MILVALLLLSSISSAFAQAGFGHNCSAADNKLAHGTFQLSTDCDAAFFCASNNTCAHKGCRRQDFPYGYGPEQHLPPKCGDGQFCPDEEDDCQQLLAVDSDCQLNRDDECAPPPDAKDLAGPRNSNGAVCLNFRCMWANATAGNQCALENVPYIIYDQEGGKEYINIVSRDNCKNGLYCDGTTKRCVQQVDLGASCNADKECSTMNCDLDGKCGAASNHTKHVATWVYIVVGVAILGGMTGVLVSLFFVHRKSRTAEQEKRSQYWREQEAFRNNIMSMREQARASLLSLPLQSGNMPPRGYRDQDYPASETSQTGMLYAAAKSSGLRNGFSDDTDADSMEESLVQTHDDDDYNTRRRNRKPSGRI